MSSLKKDIDEIVFRCFAQGQYWGTEADGKLDPGYKPEKPIDRTQAVNNILNLIESVIKESMVKELGKLEHNKRFFHKGIHVVAVSSIEERLAGLKGEYIKSKLIGKE